MKRPKWFWILAGSLFAVASVAINYEVKIGMHQRAGSVQKLGNVTVREPAPDFTLSNLAGHPVTLSSYHGRKAVLIDFWATWCGPCRAAMPGLQDLSDKFGDRGFEVVTIDQGESADQVRSFIERKKYSFQVLLDHDRTVADQYGVRGIPTSVLVDKKGVVQSIQVGNTSNDDEMQKLVERIIKE
jgi:cytochrome c biogenesis protein CcmG/thiol:disulfide interchange protein DsbE